MKNKKEEKNLSVWLDRIHDEFGKNNSGFKTVEEYFESIERECGVKIVASDEEDGVPLEGFIRSLERPYTEIG